VAKYTPDGRGGATMKRSPSLLIAVLFLVTILSSKPACGEQDVLFQTSMLIALDKGVAEGSVTIEDLKQHGDFGIGTLNAYEGELIALDGDCFIIKVDGLAYLLDDVKQTPFAMMTSFAPDKATKLDKTEGYAQLKSKLDEFLPTKNIFYAIKIQGEFSYVRTRSYPKQRKPYPTLAKLFENQRDFEFKDVKGTLVGFCCPAFVKGINVPGYHFHFLTEDRRAGGHLVECNTKAVEVEIDDIPAFHLALPESDDFFKVEAFQ
jgi:acetolactate decarboxylase